MPRLPPPAVAMAVCLSVGCLSVCAP
ncbi:unnamed protein product [Ectocarpus sp. CCAP 1310/34]|nr:unnamed protein product [Ectocarpus sp. CCAP 1310/34]